MRKTQPSHVAKPGVFVALVYEELKHGPSDSIADLAEAVKCAAARIGVHYDARQVTDAIAYVARLSPRPIVGPVQMRLPPDRLISEPPIVSREDAARILDKLESKYAVRLRDLSDPRRRDRDPDAG
jgi:hypothetical protein